MVTTLIVNAGRSTRPTSIQCHAIPELRGCGRPPASSHAATTPHPATTGNSNQKPCCRAPNSQSPAWTTSSAAR